MDHLVEKGWNKTGENAYTHPALKNMYDNLCVYDTDEAMTVQNGWDIYEFGKLQRAGWQDIKIAPKNKEIEVRGKYVEDNGSPPGHTFYIFQATHWRETK
jgi:hypothetical protein